MGTRSVAAALLLASALTPAGAWFGAPRPSARSRLSRSRVVAKDDRIYSVEIDRRTGIDFGCDLSLCWPYVLGIQPGSAAELCMQLEVGDQLLGINGINLVGAEMSAVTDTMASAEGSELRLTLFKGGRAELQQAVGYEAGPTTATITVKEEGKTDRSFTVPVGSNLRDELSKRKINVYRSLTRWTNCSGKQLCGTCIVDVTSGLDNCSRKSIDEASTLRENPVTYRLSCITMVYGDVEVVVQSPVGATQWTR